MSRYFTCKNCKMFIEELQPLFEMHSHCPFSFCIWQLNIYCVLILLLIITANWKRCRIPVPVL